ncbi:hypothetical protein [Hyphomicrobium sp.]|uniref:hypothetical protein n=1 Tax=Hyphomicrobium sp. TaxID=82 RepID=UPI002D79C20A|nr:hypothetical protein [Hyphomicrobium sp.]HET6390893.1 hypothetical protein [Hyphomicrobium sp.]
MAPSKIRLPARSLNNASVSAACSDPAPLRKRCPHPKRELLKLCARIGYTPH